MSRFRNEMILEDLKSGRIDEWDAKRQLERENGDCSCMSNSIERTVRDVSGGWRDVYDGMRSIEDSKFRCDMDENDY